MKLKLDRIISLATLAASVVAIALVLKKPAPVRQAQAPVAIVEHSPSSSPDLQAQPEPVQSSSALPAVRSEANAPVAAPASTASANPTQQTKSDDMSSMLSKFLGSAAGSAAALSPDSNVGSTMPNIKDQQVTMEGDIVHGRFLTEIAGRDVWITISGHMGEKDGYATFDPTEFKVGDMEVPVSLVNPALQRRLAEERDRLKIPNNTGSQ